MGSTLTELIYHVVFSTKDRKPMINSNMCDELYLYIGGIIIKHDAVLLQIGGIEDHLHIVIKLKPTHKLSELMQKIKGSSSKWMNKKFGSAIKFGWQDGYGAFTVSESQCSTVIKYVENQEKHHKTITFKDEFIQFLKRHKIEYDEKILWL